MRDGGGQHAQQGLAARPMGYFAGARQSRTIKIRLDDARREELRALLSCRLSGALPPDFHQKGSACPGADPAVYTAPLLAMMKGTVT